MNRKGIGPPRRRESHPSRGWVIEINSFTNQADSGMERTYRIRAYYLGIFEVDMPVWIKLLPVVYFDLGEAEKHLHDLCVAEEVMSR